MRRHDLEDSCTVIQKDTGAQKSRLYQEVVLEEKQHTSMLDEDFGNDSASKAGSVIGKYLRGQRLTDKDLQDNSMLSGVFR